jgi:hypothetical protein
MGILNKIQDWFSKEKQSFQPKEETPQPIKPEIKEVDTTQDYGKRIEECTLCKDPIEPYQKRRHFGGVFYHKNCFKQTLKLAKQQLGGN